MERVGRILIVGVDLARVAAEAARLANVGSSGGTIVLAELPPRDREPDPEEMMYRLERNMFAHLPEKRTGRPEQTKAQWRKELKGRK